MFRLKSDIYIDLRNEGFTVLSISDIQGESVLPIIILMLYLILI